MSIAEKYQKIRAQIPPAVTLVVAAKQRSVEEVTEIIRAGATHIGENYVQEAEAMYAALGPLAATVKWHMIGALQTNKINKVLRFADTIETVGSPTAAAAIDTRVGATGKRVLPVYLEVNIGNEDTKNGAPGEYSSVEALARSIDALPHLRLEGVMTMGPLTDDPQKLRPYFRQVKQMFDSLKKIPLVRADIRTLSMGMSASYRIAIEEGATMVRIGSALFGARA